MGYVTIKVVMVQNVAQRSSTFKLKAAAKGRKKKGRESEIWDASDANNSWALFEADYEVVSCTGLSPPLNLDSKTE